MAENRTIILNSLSALTKPAMQDVADLLKQAEPLGTRTTSVVIKPVVTPT